MIESGEFPVIVTIVGVLTLVLGCAGYGIARRQQGKRFLLTDPSDQEPTAEAIAGVAAVAG